MPELEFLKGYEYTLDEDHLISLGAEQSWESGIEAYERYGKLVRSIEDVFVRASDMGRVVDTAGNWTRGIADGSRGKVKPSIEVLLSEKVCSSTTESLRFTLDADFSVEQYPE